MHIHRDRSNINITFTIFAVLNVQSPLTCVCISQGSVATYLRCGGNYYIRFVGNFFLFTALQEFLKSIKIWQSYRQRSGPQFFGDTVWINISDPSFLFIDYCVQFSSYLALYNVVTLKFRLGVTHSVIGYGTIRKLGHGFIFAFHA